jgi:hypothetical protein
MSTPWELKPEQTQTMCSVLAEAAPGCNCGSCYLQPLEPKDTILAVQTSRVVAAPAGLGSMPQDGETVCGPAQRSRRQQLGL